MFFKQSVKIRRIFGIAFDVIDTSEKTLSRFLFRKSVLIIAYVVLKLFVSCS